MACPEFLSLTLFLQISRFSPSYKQSPSLSNNVFPVCCSWCIFPDQPDPCQLGSGIFPIISTHEDLCPSAAIIHLSSESIFLKLFSSTRLLLDQDEIEAMKDSKINLLWWRNQNTFTYPEIINKVECIQYNL